MSNGKTADIRVTQRQAAMLLELVTKGAVAGPDAREYAELYSNVKIAAEDLGVAVPQG